MVKPVSDSSEYTRGYQQALIDFGITQLLSNIRDYSDADFDAARACMTQQELESVAVFAILRVGKHIKGSSIPSASLRPLPQHSQNSQFSNDLRSPRDRTQL